VIFFSPNSKTLLNTRFQTRFRRVLVQIPREVPEAPVRIPCEVKIPAEAPEASVRFWRVPVQIPCEVPEVSGAAT